MNVTLKNGETEAFLCSETCSMKENEDELTIETDEIACKAVSAWAPEHPTLYMLSAQLEDEDGKVIDDLTDRVGFREVRTQGKDILLNGKKLQIKGFCRHEDHPQFGFCNYAGSAACTRYGSKFN